MDLGFVIARLTTITLQGTSTLNIVSALTFPFGFSFCFLAFLLGFLHASGGDSGIFE